jgi:hypothetical protein
MTGDVTVDAVPRRADALVALAAEPFFSRPAAGLTPIALPTSNAAALLCVFRTGDDDDDDEDEDEDKDEDEDDGNVAFNGGGGRPCRIMATT